ncbi:MAG: hypothetical protein ACLQU1_10940 [Bryobacteraceae bacterium]
MGPAKLRGKKAVLIGLEIELMQIVWQRGRATIRDVYRDRLKRRMPSPSIMSSPAR